MSKVRVEDGNWGAGEMKEEGVEDGGWSLKGAAAAEPLPTMLCTHAPLLLPTSQLQAPGSMHACMHAWRALTWNTVCPAMCLVTVGVSSGWSGRLGGRSSMASACDAWVWTVMGISGGQS